MTRTHAASAGNRVEDQLSLPLMLHCMHWTSTSTPTSFAPRSLLLFPPPLLDSSCDSVCLIIFMIRWTQMMVMMMMGEDVRERREEVHGLLELFLSGVRSSLRVVPVLQLFSIRGRKDDLVSDSWQWLMTSIILKHLISCSSD